MLKFLLPLIAALKVDGAQAGPHVGTCVAQAWLDCRACLRAQEKKCADAAQGAVNEEGA